MDQQQHRIPSLAPAGNRALRAAQLVASAALVVALTSCNQIDQSKVALEVIMFDIASGGNEAAQTAFDNRVQDIVKKQPGFIKRVTAYGRKEPLSAGDTSQRRFLIVVYWDSLEHAQAAAVVLTADPISKEQRPGVVPGAPNLYAHYVIGDSVAAGSSVPDDSVLGAGVALELVAFDTKSNTVTADLLAKDNEMDKGLISKQPGYLKRVTALGKNELTGHQQYFILVHWKSLDDAVKAAGVVSKDPLGQNISPFIDTSGYFSFAHFYDSLTDVN